MCQHHLTQLVLCLLYTICPCTAPLPVHPVCVSQPTKHHLSAIAALLQLPDGRSVWGRCSMQGLLGYGAAQHATPQTATHVYSINHRVHMIAGSGAMCSCVLRSSRAPNIWILFSPAAHPSRPVQKSCALQVPGALQPQHHPGGVGSSASAHAEITRREAAAAAWHNKQTLFRLLSDFT